MKKELAEKLHRLSEDGYHVLFTGSPYVAEIESGRIDFNEEGRLVYRDSAVVDIFLDEESEEDFEVYERHDFWFDSPTFEGV